MQVTFYSDFVCPFCFIAEQSTLKRLQAEYEFELVWKGFELHPETPRGGLELTKMFGAGRYEAMAQRVRGLAEEFGIRDLVGPPRISNTRRALAVAELARDEGCLDEFRDAVSKAYWRDGADLEDLDVLAAVAAGVGLAAAAATEAADDAELQKRIDATRLEGMRRRVTGVPTFFFDDYPVVGCQRYETMIQVAEYVGLPPRS